MAGEVRTCTNCGKKQATGDFCQKCGTRMPPRAGEAPVSETTKPAPEYVLPAQYVVLKQPGVFSKLFKFSFQGFVTRDSLRTLFTTSLVLLGIYWLLALIFGILAATQDHVFWCIGIFSSLVLVTLLIIWTRIMMELAMSVAQIREDLQKQD